MSFNYKKNSILKHIEVDHFIISNILTISHSSVQRVTSIACPQINTTIQEVQLELSCIFVDGPRSRSSDLKRPT